MLSWKVNPSKVVTWRCNIEIVVKVESVLPMAERSTIAKRITMGGWLLGSFFDMWLVTGRYFMK